MSPRTRETTSSPPIRPRRRRVGALGALALLTAAAATFAVVRDGAPAGAAVSPAPGGVTRVVSTSGTIDSSCGVGIALNTPVYTSVQDALDDAAATDPVAETVYVCAGTYTENVATNIDGIDIIGTNWDPSAPASDPSVIVAADATAPVVSLQGGAQTNVRVSGLTIEGGTYGVLSLATTGTGLEISSNVVTDQTLASIQTTGIDNGTISGNTVTPAADADGIVTKDANNYLNVQSNTVTMPAGDGVGISVVSTSLTGTLTQCCQLIGGATADLGNTITGGGTGVLVQSAPNDAEPQAYVSYVTVQNNTVTGTAGDGMAASGTMVELNFYDNTIASTGGDGIHVANPPTTSGNVSVTVRVWRNDITDAGDDGVEVTGYITGTYVGWTATDGNTITSPGDDGIVLDGFQTTAVSDQVWRAQSMVTNYVLYNTVTGAGGDGVQADQTEAPWILYNDVSGSAGDGINVSRSDYPYLLSNDIVGNGGDGIHYDDNYGSYIWTNDILSNGGDGIELTGGTSAVTADFNIVNENGSGIRYTSPAPEAGLNYFFWNNVAGNAGLDCQDQSTGTIEDEGSGVDLANDWFGNSGGTDSLPVGLCGAEVMTVDAPQYDGEVGNPYTGAIPDPPDGATGAVTWSVAVHPETGLVDLPAGLSINATTGQITGTPTEPVEDYRFVIVARDAAGNTANYVATITIYPALTADDDAVAADTGTPITPFTPTVTGGNPDTAKTFSVASTTASPLPDGLTLDPATGEVTGTPTTAGTYTVTFHVTDNSPNMEDTASLPAGSIELPANADTYTVTFTVTEAPVEATGTLPDGFETMPYTSTPPTATGGDGGPYTWSTTSPLPAGLTLDPTTGVISGTPVDGTKGFYPITLTATDGSGNSDSFTDTLEVRGADGAPMAHPVVGGITAAFLGLGVVLLRRRRRSDLGLV